MVESTCDNSGLYGSDVIKKESEGCQLPINDLGMPTVWHFESNHIGVVHPYRANGTSDSVAYMLTIYDWVKGDLKKYCHIKLWETPYHEKLFMINMLNYDVDKDKVRIVFSNIYVQDEVPAVTLVEFNYTAATKECVQKSLDDAVIPKFIKKFQFKEEISTMVALHLHSDKSLFLL